MSFDPNLLWPLPFIAWGALEAWGLAMRHDRMQPNTYWIRKVPLLARAIGVLGLSAWLIDHFLLCGASCA